MNHDFGRKAFLEKGGKVLESFGLFVVCTVLVAAQGRAGAFVV